MRGEEGERISYHEYKQKLKKITEEIKKEKKKKTIHKNKQNENLIKLEEELNRLNALYNNEEGSKGDNIFNRNEAGNDGERENLDEGNISNGAFTENLYLYSEISKKTLKNRKKMQKREMEEERNDRTRNKEGEIEYINLVEMLKKLNKTIYSIAADGNCLYESILHQLRQKIINYKYDKNHFFHLMNEDEFSLDTIDLRKYQNKKNFDFSIFQDMNPHDLTCEILRFLTSVYILQNRDLFVHFIYDEEGDNAHVDTFFNYCQEITRGMYGSEIEITALSNILQKKITVYDVNMNISYGENYAEELFICFHHKLYALGKHYNSVVDL
ncbi:conserved Plasmodium protein, unknown function [Plasmodium ovale wallikeri]|uniref:OTU domain-containing protein n=2 Tax=Plasmodium ovale TaxID=36330 RepID=A0A1C3KT22_PLAOA|nr:conserved Plasmodium protein, unknown function [Plasmodium ovale wallikeri]SBT77294.1 conserved Plasmodium protein, unknown function [Plasmodium ovale]